MADTISHIIIAYHNVTWRMEEHVWGVYMLPIWRTLFDNKFPQWNRQTILSWGHSIPEKSTYCRDPGVGWIHHICVFHPLAERRTADASRIIPLQSGQVGRELMVQRCSEYSFGLQQLCGFVYSGMCQFKSPSDKKHMGGTQRLALRWIGCRFKFVVWAIVGYLRRWILQKENTFKWMCERADSMLCLKYELDSPDFIAFFLAVPAFIVGLVFLGTPGPFWNRSEEEHMWLPEGKVLNAAFFFPKWTFYVWLLVVKFRAFHKGCLCSLYRMQWHNNGGREHSATLIASPMNAASAMKMVH